MAGDAMWMRLAVAAGVVTVFSGASLAGALPKMNVRPLVGEPLSWPEDLPQTGATLILVQDQEQQDQAASWLPFLKSELCARAPTVDYYIVPILPEGLLIVRSVVEQTIRMASDDPTMLERTVPVFTDIGELQEAMELVPTDAVQVVVLDGEGAVGASVTGPYSPEAANVLRAALNPGALNDQTEQSGICESVPENLD